MSEGGPPPGLSFPQKVHTEDEDFVIELDESHMAGHHDMYGLDDRSRCKRRKRCGQCGPCQVKENCMKCHFCIRKDVLKQTCIYRKCVYLRSKPKPYSRSHQSPSGRVSPPRDVIQHSPVVKSPPAAALAGMPYPEPGIHLPEPRTENHAYFPAQIPQQPNVAPQQNNGYISPPNPVMDARTPSLPNHTAGTPMNMQMSASPHVQNNATSPSLQKHSNASSPVVPHPVNSPMAAIHGIPTPISSSVTPHIPSMHHMGPTIPPVFPPMSSNSLSSIPHVPSLSNIPGISDRAINDFRTPDQFSLTPHHPLPHYPSVHPHMAHRDPGLFGDPSRMSHMNFNTPNHIDTFSRGPNDSSCMYHPGLPYSVPGHLQPSGPSFITGAAEMNPFRSNFLNSFPPGYSYPPDRYRDGFGSLGFPRLGMPSSAAAFPQYTGQGHGYGMGNSFSQQYLNSQHGCPKNGSRPPVSPSTDDVKVLQEGYFNDEKNKKSKALSVDLCSPKSVTSDTSSSHKGDNEQSEKNNAGMLNWLLSPKHSGLELSPRMEHLRVWADFYSSRSISKDEFDTRLSQRSFARSDSSSSKSSLWEPWKLPSWYSPRRDDVRSRASTCTLSDFECEVISVDDHQLNALIRSDGCNSIEIEFDNRSLCSGEDASPRKLPSRNSISDLSPLKTNSFEPIDKLQIIEPRSLLIPFHSNSSKCVPKSVSESSVLGISSKQASNLKLNSDSISLSAKQSKVFIDGPVIIKQDFEEDGTLQLEIPGSKVTIEDAVLDPVLEKQCSDIHELRRFLQKPDIVTST